MIFCSINEDGIEAWRLVLEGKKTVTRRIKPKVIGKDYAVQPNRGIKQVGRIEILSTMTHRAWVREIGCLGMIGCQVIRTVPQYIREREAKREGFASWDGLLSYFNSHKLDIDNIHRIEFRLLKNSCKSELEEM